MGEGIRTVWWEKVLAAAQGICKPSTLHTAHEMNMHGSAGQGKEHAKWSPVATAWYKLLPEVVITKVWSPNCPPPGPQDLYVV